MVIVPRVTYNGQSTVPVGTRRYFVILASMIWRNVGDGALTLPFKWSFIFSLGGALDN